MSKNSLHLLPSSVLYPLSSCMLSYKLLSGEHLRILSRSVSSSPNKRLWITEAIRISSFWLDMRHKTSISNDISIVSNKEPDFSMTNGILFAVNISVTTADIPTRLRTKIAISLYLTGRIFLPSIIVPCIAFFTCATRLKTSIFFSLISGYASKTCCWMRFISVETDSDCWSVPAINLSDWL